MLKFILKISKYTFIISVKMYITRFVDKSTKGSPFQAIQVATSVCLANDA